MFTGLIGFLSVLVGTGLVYTSLNQPLKAATLELVGGCLIVIGLIAIGASIAGPIAERREADATSRTELTRN